MKITVLTSNQRRHLALVESLAAVSSRVYAIQECRSVCPGQVDDFVPKSPVMREYFGRVEASEEAVFGALRFLPDNVSQLALRRDDLSLLPPAQLGEALTADVFIVFGASFLRGPLADLLIARHAVNIHMGTSPFYRGNSCNFWAIYDGRPDYVGATIHLLSKGLDSGPILFHALPKIAAVDPFRLGMEAVRAAQHALVHHLKNGTLLTADSTPQDRAKEIRYSRRSEFTDAVAAEYLSRLPSREQIHRILRNRDARAFVRPFVDDQ